MGKFMPTPFSVFRCHCVFLHYVVFTVQMASIGTVLKNDPRPLPLFSHFSSDNAR